MGGWSKWRAALVVGALMALGCGGPTDPAPVPEQPQGTGGATPGANTGGSTGGTTGTDPGTGATAGADGGTGATGTGTGSGTGSTDAGTGGTTGGSSGGSTGGTTDGGTTDAGTPVPPITFGGPGPWPVSNFEIPVSSAPGAVHETPVVGVSTDETQNLWVATNDALYLRRPGDASYTRFDANDGLHLPGNPVFYDEHYGLMDHHIGGAAAQPGISEIVGGGSNEVFVGYYGDDSGVGDYTDPARHSGKIDRVRLNADGSLTVDRLDLVAIDHGMQYWHNRTIERLVFDHFSHRHTLWVGANHGVDMLFPDKFRYPQKRADGSMEWIDDVQKEWMGDHLHPHVCEPQRDASGAPLTDANGNVLGCPSNSESGQLMGDWRGLALLPNGDVWVAGRWTAGTITWDPDPVSWIHGFGKSRFPLSFGDGYPQAHPNDEGFVNEPVFKVPEQGDPVDLSAVTVAPDGRAWFTTQSHSGDPKYGLAAWNKNHFETYKPTSDLGMPEDDIRDIVALPDGRLVLGFPNSGLVIWMPGSKDLLRVTAGHGIPDNHIFRLEVDTMVTPPAVHVSTWGGGAVLRTNP